jgi:hypothetical protein
MAKLIITLFVDDDNENIDPNDATGLTNEAYERLMGISGSPELSWLGEIEDTHYEA